jgi:hypothetical protein
MKLCYSVTSYVCVEWLYFIVMLSSMGFFKKNCLEWLYLIVIFFVELFVPLV